MNIYVRSNSNSKYRFVVGVKATKAERRYEKLEDFCADVVSLLQNGATMSESDKDKVAEMFNYERKYDRAGE